MSLLSTQLPRLPPTSPHARRHPLLPPSATAAASVSSSSSPLPLRVLPLVTSSPRSRSVAVSSAAPATVATDAGSDASSTGAQPSGNWAEFAARVSGEWDGFGADFTAAGDPVELPENVVPEAYRDWGVQVFDWQTQCPTLADPTDPGVFQYRLVRLLPTVGCEADAATVHTSEHRHANSASAFAYGPSGSHIAAWPVGPSVLEVEHCIVHPENREVRIRLVQTVALAAVVRLRVVKVFSEQWYGPFRNGDQLGGCAIRETGFAAGERLGVSEVLGHWESKDVSVARFFNSETGEFVEMSPEKLQTLFRDEAGIVTLPKQLWSLFKENANGEFLCEVGWVLSHGSAMTSRCVLSKDGNVKEMAVACESRNSKST